MTNHGALGNWYRSHLGEPLEPDHVYGYWAFLLGAFLGVMGLTLFIAASSFEVGSDNYWLLRRLGFTSALVAGPVIGLAIVYLMPLQRKAQYLAGIGLLLCLAAAAAFNVYYPSDWNIGAVADAETVFWIYGDLSEASEEIMTLYGAGLGLQFLTIFLYPLVSDDTAQPEAAAAEPESKATFELYEDRAGEHRWRLRHDNGNIVADSGEGYSSRQKARQGMQSVRTNAPGAEEETVETDTPTDAAAAGGDDDPGAADGDVDESEFEFGAASAEDTDASAARFEVYEDRGGEHRWRLRHRNGNIIADSGEGYSDRSGRDEAVERIQSVAGEADTLEYEPAGFELYADAGDEWRWRLRHRNGNVLADSGEGYASRSNAREGIDRVREYATSGDDFEVYEDAEGKFRWRLVAPNGEIVADSGQGYSRKSSANDGVERVSSYAPEADTLDYEPAAYELFQDSAEEWRWRLRHRNGNILADSGEGYTSKQKAKQGMQSVMNNAPDAEIMELAE